MVAPGKPRGILRPAAGEGKFNLSLHSPSPNLAFFVEHYWIVSWDLRGHEPYLAETLPHPCAHLVIQRGQSRIVGVVRGRFSYLLKHVGRVVGVKFKPGAFYPFLKSPVAAITDRSISLEQIFGAEGAAWEHLVLSRDGEEEMIDRVEEFLCARRPERDETVGVINAVIDRIIADREITSVDDVPGRFGMSKRTLQRLFSLYVGVSPKWVIKRYRLHEAAERLTAGEILDWPALALDLGYYDQSHFIKDFRSIVGKAPGDYAHSARPEQGEI